MFQITLINIFLASLCSTEVTSASGDYIHFGPTKPVISGDKVTDMTICGNYGGVCVASKKCGDKGTRVWGEVTFCGEYGQICCTYPKGFDYIDKHLSDVEQLWVRGYEPTAHSGVTIATGYDIGYGMNLARCLPGTIWAKLKPYRCCKSVEELARHKLRASDLTLSLAQTRKVDLCMKKKDMKDVHKYLPGKTICGEAVLVSLKRWCGLGGITGKDRYSKCEGNSSGRGRDREDYIWLCLKLGKRCTDSKLGEALVNLLAAHRRRGKSEKGYRIGRVKKEIEFLKTCTPDND